MTMDPTATVLMIKGVTSEFKNRFKAAAAMSGKPYYEFIEQLLDEHEARARRRLSQMASPLHRLTPEQDRDLQ